MVLNWRIIWIIWKLAKLFHYMAYNWLLDKTKTGNLSQYNTLIVWLGRNHKQSSWACKFILTGLHHLIHGNCEYSSSLYSPKLSLYYQLTLLPVVLSWGQMSLPWWGSCEPSMTWAVSSPTNHIAWSVDSLIQSPETVGIVINYYSTVIHSTYVTIMLTNTVTHPCHVHMYTHTHAYVTGPANQPCEHKLHQVVFLLILSALNVVFHFCKFQKKVH